jgi:hypothetical protein
MAASELRHPPHKPVQIIETVPDETHTEHLMAFLMQSSPRSSIVPVIWNVTSAVGAGGVNTIEDTWLVQYMLSMSAKSPKPMDAAARQKLLGLQVTGKCDPYTIECIKHYQSYIQKATQNSSVTVDGRVSTAAPGLKYGTAYFTIALLNMSYRDRYWNNWPAICGDTNYTDSITTELVYREMFGTIPPK